MSRWDALARSIDASCEDEISEVAGGLLLLAVRKPTMLGSVVFNASATHRRLDFHPCDQIGECGNQWNARPDNDKLLYDGYLRVLVDGSRARFDRAPLGAGSDLGLIHPGARVTFTTNARRVHAVVEYTGKRSCLPWCPLVPAAPGPAGGAGRRLAVGGVACYEPKPCDNQCEVQVAIDGAPVAHAAHTNLVGQPIDQSDVRPDGMAHNQVKRDYGGEVKVTVAEHEKAERHTYTLTMPWGVGAAAQFGAILRRRNSPARNSL